MIERAAGAALALLLGWAGCRSNGVRTSPSEARADAANANASANAATESDARAAGSAVDAGVVDLPFESAMWSGPSTIIARSRRGSFWRIDISNPTPVKLAAYDGYDGHSGSTGPSARFDDTKVGTRTLTFEERAVIVRDETGHTTRIATCARGGGTVAEVIDHVAQRHVIDCGGSIQFVGLETGTRIDVPLPAGFRLSEKQILWGGLGHNEGFVPGAPQPIRGSDAVLVRREAKTKSALLVVDPITRTARITTSEPDVRSGLSDLLRDQRTPCRVGERRESDAWFCGAQLASDSRHAFVVRPHDLLLLDARTGATRWTLGADAGAFVSP